MHLNHRLDINLSIFTPQMTSIITAIIKKVKDMKYIKEFCTCRTKNQIYIWSVLFGKNSQGLKFAENIYLQTCYNIIRFWDVNGILNLLYRNSSLIRHRPYKLGCLISEEHRSTFQAISPDQTVLSLGDWIKRREKYQAFTVAICSNETALELASGCPISETFLYLSGRFTLQAGALQVRYYSIGSPWKMAITGREQNTM